MHKACIALLSKCGSSARPPDLPPRPPSMLPISTLASNRISSCSLDLEVPPPPSALPPQMNRTVSNGSNPDYINTRMEDHSWHVGEMDRETANTKLAHFPVGTYLVRCRVQNGEKVGHALSLKTEADVKHMKICSETAPNSSNSLMGFENVLYFLSDTRKFRSIVELVTHFNRNSLRESFSGLDQNLRFSVGELFYAKALFDFAADDSEPNMLPLSLNEKVLVVDRLGDKTGWWKALKSDYSRVGFIPKDYVEELDPKKAENANTEHAKAE